MTAEIITIASLKGGAGKTTTTLALAMAAASSRLRVLVVDLDPAFSLTSALGLRGRPVTIPDALQALQPLHEVAARHPLGIDAVAGDRRSSDDAGETQLSSLLGLAKPAYDVVIIDTDEEESATRAAMAAAGRILIPSGLDILSMRAAALTAGWAAQHEALERVLGVVLVNVAAPMSRTEARLLGGLQQSGVALDAVIPASAEWGALLTGGAAEPADAVLSAGKTLLRELATRRAPLGALRQFIALAQSRPPAPIAA